MWRNEISVARDHAAPERVRADVDALAGTLADDLRLLLSAYLESQDDAVILVRRLAFECDLDLDNDPSRLARHLAMRCARALAGAIEGGSSDVVRFASTAAFRARFIGDLASGRASDRWYYRAFAGVRMLPCPAAIRTVLLDDVAVGRAALPAIDESAWPALLATLTPREALRIVTALAPATGATADIDARAGWIAAVVPRLHPAACSPSLLAVRALALALGEPGVAERIDAQTAYLAGAIAAAAGEAAPGELLRELDERGPAMFERFAEPATRREARSWLGATDASARAVCARALTALAPTRAQPSARTDDDIATPCAGYALLLGEIDALLDHSFCEALPPVANGEPRAVAALAVLATAAGPAHGAALVRDGAWRTVLGITPSFDYSDFAAALGGADASAAFDAMRARVAGHARGEPVTVAFRSHEQRWRATVDMPSRLWLDLAMQGDGAHDTATWRTRLSAARGARRDHDALAWHGAAQAVPAAWRAIFVMLAQVAWRRIAYRVTGMAGASLGYLRANLVPTHGIARHIFPGRYRFEMPRPPLHVLLKLCGFVGAEVSLSGVCTIVLDYS